MMMVGTLFKKVCYGAFALLFMLALFMAGCVRNELSAPTNLNIDEDLVLTWDSAQTDCIFGVNVNGTIYSTREKSMNMQNIFGWGNAYSIKVCAYMQDYYSGDVSPWSAELMYERPLPAGITIEYHKDEDCYILHSADSSIVSGDFIVPGNYKNKAVRYIEGAAFRDCVNLTGIILSPGITGIGSYAFADCYNVAKIMLPDTVDAIGDHAFEGINCCSVIIPHSVEIILNDAFSGCTIYVPYGEDLISWQSAIGGGVLMGSWSGNSNVVYNCEFEYVNDYPYVKSVLYKNIVEVSYPQVYPGNTSFDMVMVYPRIVPEREGYTFLGWALEEGGDVEYAACPIEQYSNFESIMTRPYHRGAMIIFPDDEFLSCPLNTVFYAIWSEA